MKAIPLALVSLFLFHHSLFSTDRTDQPNVLMIIVDDLNQYVGYLNHYPNAKTPNIDALATRGLAFTRAYCASPQCNPSRTATFSGQRPSTTGVYANGSRHENVLTKDQMLTTVFHQAGYYMAGAGKIHRDVEDDFGHLDAYQPKKSAIKPIMENKGNLGHHRWSEITNGDEAAEDEMTVRFTIEQLEKKRDDPFFLICGIYKPHLSWNIPQKYFEMHPPESLQLPPILENDLNDVPWESAQKIINKGDNIEGAKPEDFRGALRAYLAASSYADACVGRVIEALDRSRYADNTIIVLWGDHGYHLGEKNQLAKRKLWEDANRIPYLWIAPGITTPGTTSNRPVDLMSLYPTLCDIAGIPLPSHLEGPSVRPILENPRAEWDHPAVMTYFQNNHAVRTQEWRYIRYADGEEELYDVLSDPYEWNNLAARPELESVKKQLAQRFPKINAPDTKPKG